MISKIAVVFALIGAAFAAPAVDSGIMGKLPSGAGFKTSGDTTAGAAADEDSGVAGGSLDGKGTVLGLAGPNFGFGAAVKSPGL